MKRIVILLDSFYRDDVRAHLVNLRIQYSISTDLVLHETRVSVPKAKAARLLAELRRSAIYYELI